MQNTITGYDANLTTFGHVQVTPDQRKTANTLFSAKMDELFGSREAVANAYKAHSAVDEKYKESPLPSEATQEEKAAVAVWLDAVGEATAYAFADWVTWPEGVYFEITLQ